VPRGRWWRPAWLLGLARAADSLRRSSQIDWSDAYHVHRFTQQSAEHVVLQAGFEIQRRLLVVDHVQQVPHIILVGRSPG
jgi:hypothetical protein